jgi:hypothetical protein
MARLERRRQSEYDGWHSGSVISDHGKVDWDAGVTPGQAAPSMRRPRGAAAALGRAPGAWWPAGRADEGRRAGERWAKGRSCR